MINEVSQNVREAVTLLPQDAIRAASGHIATAAEILIDTLHGADNEDAEMAVELLEEVAENETRSQSLLRKGASLLIEYANLLDGTGSAVDTGQSGTQPPKATPKLPQSRPAQLSMPTIPVRRLKQLVDDVIQRQYEDGEATPAEPAWLLAPGERHISDYEDGEPFTLPTYVSLPDEICVPTLKDLANLLQVVQDTTNRHYHGWAIDEVLLHEAEHAELDAELVRQYGATRQDGSPQLGHSLRLIVHGPPAKNPENGAEYIPSTPVPFTVLSNIAVPAIAVALAPIFPREPSPSDVAAVKRQGFRDRNDVLRWVREYNKRPGVKPLPLPKV